MTMNVVGSLGVEAMVQRPCAEGKRVHIDGGL